MGKKKNGAKNFKYQEKLNTSVAKFSKNKEEKKIKWNKNEFIYHFSFKSSNSALFHALVIKGIRDVWAEKSSETATKGRFIKKKKLISLSFSPSPFRFFSVIVFHWPLSLASSNQSISLSFYSIVCNDYNAQLLCINRWICHW